MSSRPIETRPVKVFKLEVLVIDHDGLGEKGIRQELESVRFPNDCMSPELVAAESREVEWHDGHPLNMRNGWRDAYANLFAPPVEVGADAFGETMTTGRGG